MSIFNGLLEKLGFQWFLRQVFRVSKVEDLHNLLDDGKLNLAAKHVLKVLPTFQKRVMGKKAKMGEGKELSEEFFRNRSFFRCTESEADVYNIPKYSYYSLFAAS